MCKKIAIFINSKGDSEKDLNTAAAVFNENIWGHDYGPPLNRISRRFEELGIKRTLWVLIDGIQNPSELADIASFNTLQKNKLQIN
ncbi:MAG: hypothetical protein FVQ82_08460 [Planctomycetes bacterium]|nr:hypothetical protein [Planctomycetota bacterium]